VTPVHPISNFGTACFSQFYQATMTCWRGSLLISMHATQCGCLDFIVPRGLSLPRTVLLRKSQPGCPWHSPAFMITRCGNQLCFVSSLESSSSTVVALWNLSLARIFKDAHGVHYVGKYDCMIYHPCPSNSAISRWFTEIIYSLYHHDALTSSNSGGPMFLIHAPIVPKNPSCRRNKARLVPLLQKRIAYDRVLIVAG